MIENLKFENFRGFDRLELSDIKPLTLISGKNNVGKSSILEGIFLLFDHIAPESFAKINQFRRMPVISGSVNLWESAFYQMNTARPLRISMTADGIGTALEYVKDTSFIPPNDANAPQEFMNQMVTSAQAAYTLKFQYQKGDYKEEGHFVVGPAGWLRNMTTTLEYNQVEAMPFTQFINNAVIGNEGTVPEWFGRMELGGKKQQIIEVLQSLDSRISDLSTIAANGQTMLYAKIDNQLLPLTLAGDGLNKLLFMVLAIIANPHSILLIDEIESGFHYSMYPKLWEIIARTAQENDCQVIATTHSYECIAGAVDGIEAAGRKDNFCYFRIGRRNGTNGAHYYSEELLRTAVETDMEVR